MTATAARKTSRTNMLIVGGVVVSLVLGFAYTMPKHSASNTSARDRAAAERGLTSVQKRLADIQAGSASLQEQINLAEKTDTYLPVLASADADSQMRLQIAAAFEEVSHRLGLDLRGLDPHPQTPANVPGTLRAMTLTVGVVGGSATLESLLRGLQDQGLLVTIASMTLAAQDASTDRGQSSQTLYLSPNGSREMQVSFYVWYSVLPRLLLPGSQDSTTTTSVPLVAGAPTTTVPLVAGAPSTTTGR